MIALFAAVALVSGEPPRPHQAPRAAIATPITLGTSLRLRSRALVEQRTINVVVPPGYAKSPRARFPVVYVVDGGIDQDLVHVAGTEWLGEMLGRNSPAIIVGIETRDRQKELVGRTADVELLRKYPRAGQSAAFRKFLRDEVKPLVERLYRTTGYDALIGESLAGLFVLETYLTDPGLFSAYGAISPSLWWDQQALSLTAAARIGERQVGHPLYLAIGDEGEDMQSGVDRVVAALGAKAKAWCYAARPDLTHATIYHTLTPTLFQFLVPPAEAPPPAFGFEVKCSRKS